MSTVIIRAITEELLTLTREYPVVTILGPRQAGKTTLAQAGLPGYAYSNLESPEVRELAQEERGRRERGGKDELVGARRERLPAFQERQWLIRSLPASC